MYDVHALVNATDAELDTLFRDATTLALDQFVNTGDHHLDVARREIVNDRRWKGFLPRGLPLNEVAARLATGYAKRFWMQKGACRGETQYFDARVNLKHLLREVTIDAPVNDLTPGRYIILAYTDPVFEHVFYDVMKAVSPDVILYRGYTGEFPNGRRGWTGPLIRRYGFAQAGLDDHDDLMQQAAAPPRTLLPGTWRMDIVHGMQSTGVARLIIGGNPRGRLTSRLEVTDAGRGLIPPVVVGQFTSADFTPAARVVRRVDDNLLVGTWTTDLEGPFAKLVLAGSVRVFRPERTAKGRRRFALRYLLWRE